MQSLSEVQGPSWVKTKKTFLTHLKKCKDGWVAVHGVGRERERERGDKVKIDKLIILE